MTPLPLIIIFAVAMVIYGSYMTWYMLTKTQPKK